MLTEELKLTALYHMYAMVFQVDVPMTQSQPIESTQGTHRTLSAPRTPNPVTTQGESSAPRKPTVIRFRVRSQPDPETPIPTAAEIDIDSLDEATRLSIATQRSIEDLEAQQNMSLWIKNFNSQEDLDTRIESESHKKCPDVKKSANVLIIHDDEGEELVRDALIHRKREKGK
ncbi:hypothetical protein Tco_0816154 [Tanacetum coccineum]